MENEKEQLLYEERQRIAEELAGRLAALGYDEQQLTQAADATDSTDPVRFAEAMARQCIEIAEERAIKAFVALILHGDDSHRGWLQEAGEQFLDYGTVPPPRGKGTATP